MSKGSPGKTIGLRRQVRFTTMAVLIATCSTSLAADPFERFTRPLREANPLGTLFPRKKEQKPSEPEIAEAEPEVAPPAMEAPQQKLVPTQRESRKAVAPATRPTSPAKPELTASRAVPASNATTDVAPTQEEPSRSSLRPARVGTATGGAAAVTSPASTPKRRTKRPAVVVAEVPEHIPLTSSGEGESSRRTTEASVPSKLTLRSAQVVPLGDKKVEQGESGETSDLVVPSQRSLGSEEMGAKKSFALRPARAKPQAPAAESPAPPTTDAEPYIIPTEEPSTAEFVEEVETASTENLAPIVDAATLPRPKGLPRRDANGNRLPSTDAGAELKRPDRLPVVLTGPYTPPVYPSTATPQGFAASDHVKPNSPEKSRSVARLQSPRFDLPGIKAQEPLPLRRTEEPQLLAPPQSLDLVKESEQPKTIKPASFETPAEKPAELVVRPATVVGR